MDDFIQTYVFFVVHGRVMNSNVRKITDGAMMCAIVGLLLVADRWLGGLFSGTFLFAFPLPMVFYSTKYGMKDSWMVLAAMSLLGFIISGPTMLFYIGCESLLGLIYGSGVHSHKPTEHLVLSAMLIGILVNLLSTVVFAAFFGYNLMEDIEFMQSTINNVAAQSGVVFPDTLMNVNTMKTLLVVGAIMTGVLEGYVTHLLSRLMMKRLRLHVEPIRPLAYYFPPKWTGYLGFAGLMAYEYAMLRPLDNAILQNACVGLGMLGIFYLVMFGSLFVMMVFSRSRKRSSLLVTLLIFFLILSAALLMAVAGFLYITTDLHQRMLGGDSHAEKNV